MARIAVGCLPLIRLDWGAVANLIGAIIRVLEQQITWMEEESMAEEKRSADVLVEAVQNTPGVMDALKANPEETLKQLAAQATQQTRVMEQDRWIYRMVVFFLGFVVCAVVVGIIGMMIRSGSAELKIPDVLTALGSASIGALAGILAPSPIPRSG
jgi:hypothetical protein